MTLQATRDTAPGIVLSLAAQLDCLTNGRVLVVGDVMLDTYLTGDAQRISPEAPVPVVRVDETRHMLGGAGNVARNIAALGGSVGLVGVIGEDFHGGLVQDMLRESGVAPCLIRCGGRPTTIKTRVLARNQQMIRLDQEDASAVSQAVYADMLARLTPLLGEYEVIVVSDYSKGVVGPALLADMRRLAAQSGKSPRILVDPKPQHTPYYHGAYLLTPNTKETSEAAGLPIASKADILVAGEKLRSELRAEHVLTTLGSAGMALFGADGSVTHVATTARQVFDVTGAGDTVIAAVALALAAGVPLLEACVLANYAAGIVVGKVGAATASHEELRAAIAEFPPVMETWK